MIERIKKYINLAYIITLVTFGFIDVMLAALAQVNSYFYYALVAVSGIIIAMTFIIIIVLIHESKNDI